jgi:hypothetical protein
MRDNTQGLSVSEKLDYYSMPEPMSGCTLWVGSLAMDGYGQLGINKRNLRAHRVAWEEAIGPIPEGMKVLHKCDNKACVNVKHLFVGTQMDNIKDRDIKGRGIKGEQHKLSKLTENDVVSIKEMLRNNIRVIDIAKKYGMSKCRISQIKCGTAWRHVS